MTTRRARVRGGQIRDGGRAGWCGRETQYGRDGGRLLELLGRSERIVTVIVQSEILPAAAASRLAGPVSRKIVVVAAEIDRPTHAIGIEREGAEIQVRVI